MLLKFLGKEYPLKYNELENKTIGGLKEQIRKSIFPCAEVSNENILLFHNKAKINATDETSLDDESVNLKDDSVVYIVSLSLNKSTSQKTQASPTNTSGASNNLYNNMNSSMGNMNSSMGTGMNDNMSGMGGMSNNMNFGNTANMFNGSVNMDEMFDKLLANPELMNNMYENMANFLPVEQRQSFAYAMEMFKKNPEMMRSMIKTFGNQNGGFPMGNLMTGMPQNMGGMNPNMGGMTPNMNGMTPNMNGMNPNMGGMNSNMNGMNSNMGGMNPNMGGMNSNMGGMNSNMNGMNRNMGGMTPNMGMMNNMNGMMNNYARNTGGMSPDMNGRRFGMGPTNLSYSDLFELVFNCPKDGPCCHYFYPLKEVDGNKVQQSPEDVYTAHLNSLNEMGFSDKQENLQALIQSKGDLAEAIEILTKKNHK